MAKEIDIYIPLHGPMRAIYDDALVDIFGAEALQVTRASHVEPHPTGPGWLADLRPVGGPVLGQSGAVDFTHPDTYDRVTGFPTRQAALEAEVAWLHAQLAAGRLEVQQ